MKSPKEPRYGYTRLEIALANVFGVAMKDAPAFKARIRHLRNLGVPPTGRPGRGKRISYSRDNAIQILIALEAELLGLLPQLAASFSRSAMTGGLVQQADKASKAGEVFFLSVDPKFEFDLDNWILVQNPGAPPADKEVHRRIVINLAKSISLLDRELDQTAKRRDPFDALRGQLGRSKRRR